MESETTIDPSDIDKHPKIIREAQEEILTVDVFVCGQCHSVFHYVEHFQEHRDSGECTGVSQLRENNISDTKSQIWAFLLWKHAQNFGGNDAWGVFQKWCQLEPNIKESWIAAGKNVQTFTKLGVAKMQEIRNKMKKMKDDSILEEGEIKDSTMDYEDPSDADSEMDSEDDGEKEEILKLRNAMKNNGTTEGSKDGTRLETSRLAKRTDKITNTVTEHLIEKLLAKRFNPRKKVHEYLVKWEGLAYDQNTWESPANLSTCLSIVQAFERNLQRQKEAKAAAQVALLKKDQLKQQAGPSGIVTLTPGGRPQRTSKQKALDQVKQWCGNISDRDDELGMKRTGDSDSDDDPEMKRIKMELDSGSEDEWHADEEEIDRHTSVGRPKILQKSNVLNGIAKKQMTASEVAKSIGLTSPDRSNSPTSFLASAKGVVKVLKHQVPNLASGVYIMSKKDGLVKLKSTPSNLLTSGANIVRVQKTVGSQGTVFRVDPKSHMRVMTKGDANAVRLSPGMSRPLSGTVAKFKTVIKPRVTTVQAPVKTPVSREQVVTAPIKVNRLKPIQQSNEVEKESESSEEEFDPFPKDLGPVEPDSPPREFTLDPISGLILGQTPETEKETPETPLETEEKPEKMETNEEAQVHDMPSLIMQDTTSSLEEANVATTLSETTTLNETTATITLPETGEPLMITGEDGVVYQVAGQNEEGQTLLVAQGADGQQQCVYVTTAAEDGQANNTVLTLDSAVAEAMGDNENTGQQASTSEGTEMEPITINTEESAETSDDPNGQVVAQLVKAELPSPGGTRKVVLLLPDGNLLMTEVDAEQYAALELDK